MRGAWNEVELSFSRHDVTDHSEKIDFASQAHFSRFSGLAQTQAKILLGSADWDAIGLDSCQIWDKSAERDGALRIVSKNPAAWIELVDAGRIDLQMGPNAAALLPIDYPDLVNGLSGTAYLRDQRSLEWRRGEPVTLRSSGSHEIAAFEMNIKVSSSFPDLRALSGNDELWFEWKKPEVETAEPMLLELKSTGGSNPSRLGVRCRAIDDGSFTLPAAGFRVIGASAAQGRDMSWTATATRVTRARLTVPTMGPGEVKISLRDTITLNGF